MTPPRTKEAAPVAAGTASTPADTYPLIKEAPAVETNPIHRPVNVTYSHGDVSVVATVDARPRHIITGIETSGVITAFAVFECGPLRVRFDDVPTVNLWISALTELAVKLGMSEHDADGLRREATADAFGVLR